jgi:hypothetical protein
MIECMFWKKKTSATTEESCAQALFKTLAESLTKNGRTRAEDLITASASIAAELCIEVAGNFNPRNHKFVPGSRVFSDKVNELLAGNSDDIETAPAESIVGTLRDKLLVAGYTSADFPSLKTVFEHFAANVGKPSDWGKVPLSVSEENKPSVLPLRVAYETRATVDRVFHSLVSPPLKLRAATLTLAEVLIAVQHVIKKNTALLLALETVNGMAKTAPMTDDAIASANKLRGQ